MTAQGEPKYLIYLMNCDWQRGSGAGAMIASHPASDGPSDEDFTRKKAASEAPNPVRDADRPPPNQRPVPANPPTVPSQRARRLPEPDAASATTSIQFQIPEFTCHCPLTGQPDFAHFTIEMVADKLCVELKSLKMYFWSYRDDGAFHEKVTNDIVDDIVKATDPRFIRITAKWNVRGGIYTNVVAEHRKKGWKPQPRVEL